MYKLHVLYCYFFIKYLNIISTWNKFKRSFTEDPFT